MVSVKPGLDKENIASFFVGVFFFSVTNLLPFWQFLSVVPVTFASWYIFEHDKACPKLSHIRQLFCFAHRFCGSGIQTVWQGLVSASQYQGPQLGRLKWQGVPQLIGTGIIWKHPHSHNCNQGWGDSKVPLDRGRWLGHLQLASTYNLGFLPTC